MKNTGDAGPWPCTAPPAFASGLVRHRSGQLRLSPRQAGPRPLLRRRSLSPAGRRAAERFPGRPAGEIACGYAAAPRRAGALRASSRALPGGTPAEGRVPKNGPGGGAGLGVAGSSQRAPPRVSLAKVARSGSSQPGASDSVAGQGAPDSSHGEHILPTMGGSARSLQPAGSEAAAGRGEPGSSHCALLRVNAAEPFPCWHARLRVTCTRRRRPCLLLQSHR